MGQDAAADGADQVDGLVGDDARGLDDLVAGGFRRDGEAAPVWVGRRVAVGGVRDRDPQGLVDRQQRVDLLGDAGGGAGAQDATAEHGPLDLEVGGLDLPALVVEPDQLEGWVAPVVKEGGGQPVDACVAPRCSGDGDLALDDAYGYTGDDRAVGAVAVAAHDGCLADGGQAGEQVGAGARDGGEEGVGGEAPVE